MEGTFARIMNSFEHKWEQFIEEKAQKLLHFFERLTMIEVTVDLQKDQKLVEFVVQAEHKHDIVARESHHDLLAAALASGLLADVGRVAPERLGAVRAVEGPSRTASEPNQIAPHWQ